MMPEDLDALDFEPAVQACECPACFAHPTGRCFQAAVWKTALHEIHGCDKPDLTPAPQKAGDPPAGAAIRLLCNECLTWHRRRAEELAQRARTVFKLTGGVLVCRTCQCPLTDVDAFLSVEAFSGL